MTELIAYHGDPQIKADLMAQLQAHYDADQIVKAQYWREDEDGVFRGCAVGCTLHSDDHMEYELRFGVPVMIGRLNDAIFEGLADDTHREWPLRLMSAMEPGQDLSLVGWKFLHWLLTDQDVYPGINHETVRDAVKQCADVIKPLTKGEPADADAESAAAWAAAREAARAAESAANAAWAAARAAASAAWTADSAGSAGSAAWAAADSAAWAAASAAESAGSAAESAAWPLMADKLIELIKEAPTGEQQ